MTSAVVVVTSLLLVVAMTSVWSRDDTVEYQLMEESPPGTLVGDLLHDVSGLAGEVENQLRFSIVTSSVQPGQFEVGEQDGRLMTSSRVDREGACPSSDATDCVIQLSVAVRPLSVFRLITVVITVVDINDHSPVFPTTSYQLNVSEAASAGASFSLPVAEDRDVEINGQLEYQLLPGPGESVFQLVQSLNVVDGFTDVQLVLKSPLDREQVITVASLYLLNTRTADRCAAI